MLQFYNKSVDQQITLLERKTMMSWSVIDIIGHGGKGKAENIVPRSFPGARKSCVAVDKCSSINKNTNVAISILFADIEGLTFVLPMFF